MAKPQLKDGFTSIANELLEKLARISLAPNQWQVFLVIIRKTYGFHKKVDYIANFQIGEATGLGKTVISRCLKGLADMNLISRKGKIIGIQKDWEKWKGLTFQASLGVELAEQLTSEKLAEQSTKVSNLVEGLAKLSTKVSSPEVTQKIKDTTTKDKRYIIPKWIDEKTWEAFLEMRKRKRAIPTERAKELLVKELEKLRAEGHDPTEVLNQSIMRNYTGVFPLKGGQDGTHRQNSRKLPKKYRSPSEIYGDRDD